jgi:hypothetical protein
MANVNSNVNDPTPTNRLLESISARMDLEGRALLPSEKAHSTHVVGAVGVQGPSYQELLKVTGSALKLAKLVGVGTVLLEGSEAGLPVSQALEVLLK